MIRGRPRHGQRICARSAGILATVVLGAGTFIFAPPSGADVPSVNGSAYG